MEYVKSDMLAFDARVQISRVFSDGFYQWLCYFGNDKAKLAIAFEHMFDLSEFYVAADGGKIAAIAACTDGVNSPVKLDKTELRHHLGFVRGTMAFKILKAHLQEHKYPFELTRETGSIEFVATAADFRGKGVAGGLLEHIMAVTEYSEYVLEVADTNENAVRLYERLGFKEFMRVPEKNPKRSKLNFYVYMRLKR
jgi:ribosomal protein S18 acetylase RimI-like enzyme